MSKTAADLLIECLAAWDVNVVFGLPGDGINGTYTQQDVELDRLFMDVYGQCADVVREAFSRPGPALIEAVVDPNEPPLPPKATFEQAKHLVEAIARGTPDAGTIARNIAREKIRELV
jgi:thiamine pyrophosphate-dependent acetolactate synthase large subunit-like protein